MNKSALLIPVCAMAGLDPASGRVSIDVPFGSTIQQILDQVLPSAPADLLTRARIWLVTNDDQMVLDNPAQWPLIRPQPGVRVMIRITPANQEQLRSAFMIAVSIGATALGQLWAAPALTAAFSGLGAVGAGIAGQIGGALVTAGIMMAGGYLVNLALPQTGAGNNGEKPTYITSGFRNTATPDGQWPSLCGRLRMAPLYLIQPWIEVVGDEQYTRALLTFGHGQVQISDLRIKDTPIERFADVQWEYREGLPGDAAITLCTQQVIQDSLGAELRRDRLRNDDGSIGDVGPAIPVSRFTAADATEACVIFQFPGGLGQLDDEGQLASYSLDVRIRARLNGSGAWEPVTVITLSAAKAEGFYRDFRWTLPERGKWEVECTLMTSEPVKRQANRRMVWLMLQSFRPEYPIAFDKPVSLLAVRIRASSQLSGQLDTLNALAERLVPDFDSGTGTWITRKTRNPASYLRLMLQGRENLQPEANVGIDFAQLEDFHNFCRVKGLRYDRLHDFESSLWAALSDVARAGRASPRHDGRQWGLVIDRPSDLVVAHVNARNSRGFGMKRSYFEPPHAYRVTFLDETSDYQSRERIVRWPGYAGDITVAEEITMPGKTNPAEVYREVRRRQYEAIYRSETFTAIQDGAVRTATRGDLVRGSQDIIDPDMISHRVTAVRGQLINLDGYVEMDAGQSYGIEFMRQVGSGDAATFVNTRRTVQNPLSNGATSIEVDHLLFEGDGAAPPRDTFVQFGRLNSESIDLIVAGTETGEGFSTILQMLPAAPIIDQLTDAEVIPAWNGRVGSEQGPDVTVPAIPAVIALQTHFTEAGDADGLIVLLGPGLGNTAQIGRYAVRHRLTGVPAWSSPIEVAAGAGGVTITGYTGGQTVELQRLAISRSGYASDWSNVFSRALPAPADAPAPISSATVTAGLGNAVLQFATPIGPNLATVRIYRGLTASIADASLVATLPVVAGSSYGHVDGDNTRPNLLANSGFDSDVAWTKGTGWSIVSGVASKAAGTQSAISQNPTLVPGDAYRSAYTVSGFGGAGSIRSRFTGGTTVNGTLRTANGRYFDRLIAGASSTTFGINADASFVGSVDDAVLYRESSTSLAQGAHYYFLRTANANGREGAPLAMLPVTIV